MPGSNPVREADDPLIIHAQGQTGGSRNSKVTTYPRTLLLDSTLNSQGTRDTVTLSVNSAAFLIDATTTDKGIVELATQAEVDAGTSSQHVVTPETLANYSGLVNTVTSDATLTGDGTGGSPLGLARQGATDGQVLKWNGATWLPGTDNGFTGVTTTTRLQGDGDATALDFADGTTGSSIARTYWQWNGTSWVESYLTTPFNVRVAGEGSTTENASSSNADFTVTVDASVHNNDNADPTIRIGSLASRIALPGPVGVFAQTGNYTITVGPADPAVLGPRAVFQTVKSNNSFGTFGPEGPTIFKTTSTTGEYDDELNLAWEAGEVPSLVITPSARAQAIVALADDALNLPNNHILFMLTGANAGASRAITDYVQGTRTVTTGAFGNANAPGDRYIVADGTPGVAGTAQGGSSSTIQLAVGASAVDDEYNNREIILTNGGGSGLSVGDRRTIVDYDGTTKVATVSPAWEGGVPDGTTSYVLGYVDPASGLQIAGTLTTGTTGTTTSVLQNGVNPAGATNFLVRTSGITGS